MVSANPTTAIDQLSLVAGSAWGELAAKNSTGNVSRYIAAKLLTKTRRNGSRRTLPSCRKALASSWAAHHIIVVMARRKNITPSFGIEDEILAAPIASISDIATKLEIVSARAELFDVSDDLERLHDQIVAFRARESLAPPACNWYAT